MSSAIRNFIKRFFLPVFIVAMTATFGFILWAGESKPATYRDMACVFEERSPGCLDSVFAWNEGLSFYDSLLLESKDTLQSLKALLWEHWNIEFAGAGDAAVERNSILPLAVLEQRKSGCMGLSWLAMMVAEARQIPLNAILLPGHVFLRYGKKDDGRGQFGFSVTTVNLEPNRRGFSYTDEEYREKYREGPWTGLEFKPLSVENFVGLAAFDMGNLYLDSDVHRALTWYRMAEEFFPQYPGIAVNQEIAKSRLP